MKKILFWLFAGLFFFVPLILWPYTSEVFEFNKMVLVYLLTTLIVTSWLVRNVIEKKWIFRRTILDIPLLIFVGSQLVSTILSIDPRTSWLGYYSRFNGGLLSSICYSLLYWAFVSNFEKDHVIKFLNYSLFPGAVLVSIYAVAEHFGIDKHIWYQDVQTRVFSTLGQPNWLAAWLVSIIPVTWVLSVKSEITKKNTYIYAVLSLLFFWTLIFTKSRSGILGFLVAFLIFWGIYFWQRRKTIKTGLHSFLLVGLPLLVAILVSGTPWTPNIGSLLSDKPPTQQTEIPSSPALEVGGTESGSIRKIVWKGALDIWKNYPVFGTGVETFAYSYYRFRPKEHNLVSEWDFIYNKAHNEYLNLMANTGTIGILSYFILIAFAVWQISNLKKGKPVKIEEINLALLAGYVSVLVTNFFGFSVVPTQLMLFLIPAFAIVLGNDYSVESNKQKIETAQYIGIFIILCISIYLVLMSIKYWYADTLYAKGKSYNSVQQQDVAANYLARAIHQSPNEGLYHSELSSSYANIALALDEQEESEKARYFTDLSISESDRATSLSPVNLNFQRTRFGTFVMLSTINPKYMADALKTIENLAKSAPTDAKIFYHYGLTLARTDQSDKSIEVFKKSIELKPDYKESRIALAIMLDERGDKKEAISQLEYILNNIDPNDSLTKQTLDGIK